ncbi:MAG: helix-turn-helix domain-containing protein [Chitinophagaceae bacterium]|nr:helix-turn-helix domain-containing protein [Chitinophagaceae bacterium]
MFHELDTKKIGQSIGKLRKRRDIKASEVAAHLKIGEQAYTKYERGETPVTISFLNKVAQFFDVNPIHFITNGPESIVENVHNSIVSSNNNSTITNIDKDLIEALKYQLGEKDKQLEQLLVFINKK